MRGVNKVIIVGTLGRDPEVRALQSGSVASLSIATSEAWKDKNTGQTVEQTEWHRVTLYGKLADIAGEYLRKGSKVFIEGSLHTRKWQDKNTGQDRYSTEIKGSSLQMLDGKPQGGGRGDGGYDQDTDDYREERYQQGRQQQGGQQSRGGASRNAPPPDYDDSDLPF